MSRKRQVALLNIVEMNNLSDRALNGHTPVSLLFNPQVSVALQYRELQDFNRRLYAASKESGNTSSVPIHITSDGTNATVEFLE
jgi:hypothetical protein